MKIRIRFTKNECIQYLGHLDIMRAFQKCMNRAEIRMVYSEGFNPHQKMSFALPLGVGVTSTAEYLDAEVADGQDLMQIKEKLQEVSGPGFDILEVKALKEGAEKVMAAVRYADFEALLPEPGFTAAEIEDFLSQPEILAVKKTKKGEKIENIRPMIKSLTADGNRLFMLLSAGSEHNLKAVTLLSSLYEHFGRTFEFDQAALCRTELRGEEFLPLGEMDTE